MVINAYKVLSGEMPQPELCRPSTQSMTETPMKVGDPHATQANNDGLQIQVLFLQQHTFDVRALPDPSMSQQLRCDYAQDAEAELEAVKTVEKNPRKKQKTSHGDGDSSCSNDNESTDKTDPSTSASSTSLEEPTSKSSAF